MRDMSAAPHIPHMINGMRVLSVLGLAFMAKLPAVGFILHLHIRSSKSSPSFRVFWSISPLVSSSWRYKV